MSTTLWGAYWKVDQTIVSGEIVEAEQVRKESTNESAKESTRTGIKNQLFGFGGL
ncbi:hypothetical protein [Ferrimonas pelagia]|uniref:Uncharacterized protein n=1 Tax=Ferrimonas pelagia TaxID=1177826 RepID=A0ABP9F0R5_9GAMM